MAQGTEDRVLESLRLDHETFKHLTTVSTGSILILATFLEKLFEDPELKWLIPLTFMALMISAYTSVVEMFRISHTGVLNHRGPRNEGKWRTKLIAISSCGCFLLGMLCLSVFAAWNFWRTAA